MNDKRIIIIIRRRRKCKMMKTMMKKKKKLKVCQNFWLNKIINYTRKIIK